MNEHEKPNILMFITDGHRADSLGCYGNPVLRTPHVDAFAREGARFTGAYSAHTVCMPSRASIWTSRYPHVHGVWANGVPLSRDEVTLPQVLADNGYRTCAAGKIHLEPQQGPEYPPRIAEGESYYGFQEVHLSENKIGAEYLQFVRDEFPDLAEAADKRRPVPEDAHELAWITGRAIDFVRRSATDGAPFLCSCSFHELSPPCHPPLGFDDLYRPEDMPPPKRKQGELDNKPPYYTECYDGQMRLGRYPDDDTYRRYMTTYYNQTTFIDKQFGRIIAALDDLGVADRTIVLFTADHGLTLNDHWQWRHGPFLMEQVINVPMIWRVPAPAPQGRVVEELVESVDIMPTILDLCGVGPPPGVQGRSITPLLAGAEGAEGRESILAQDRESPELLAREVDPAGFKIIAVRTSEWKLIHYPGEPHGELYHLASDPDEFENLWPCPEHLRTRRQMERLLLDRLAAAEDPLPRRRYSW